MLSLCPDCGALAPTAAARAEEKTVMALKRVGVREWSIATALMLASAGSSAENWEWGSSVALNSAWADNPALADENRNPPTTFRFLGVYEGEFVRLGDNNTLSFRPRVTRDYYPDKQFKDLESTDLFLPTTLRYAEELRNWSLGLNLSRQNVLSDEASIDDGTGLNRLNADDLVYRASLTPTLSWSLTEKDQLVLGITGNITDYELDFTNRADSTSIGGNFIYTRLLTDTQTLGFTAQGVEFSSERLTFFGVTLPTIPPTIEQAEARFTNDSTNTSLTLDYNFALSPITRITLRFGLQNTDATNSIVLTGNGETLFEDDFQFRSTTYDARFSRVLRNGEYSIGAVRAVSPAVNGQPQDRYEINFEGEIKHTSKLLSRWRLRVFQQENILLAATDTAFTGKTTFFSGEYTASWQFSRRIRLNARYRYRYRQRDTGFNEITEVTATGNEIGIGINYAWKLLRR